MVRKPANMGFPWDIWIGLGIGHATYASIAWCGDEHPATPAVTQMEDQKALGRYYTNDIEGDEILTLNNLL